MQERVKQIWDKIVEFWNKYSKKQKTIVFSVLGTIVIAIIILAFTLTKTNYVSLMKCEDTKGASEVVDLLKGEGIDCQIGDDYVTVLVDKASYNDAVIVAGKNDIPSSGMSYEDALSNDMSTSESEKKLKTTLALQTEVRQKLMQMDGIKDATVFINQPEDDFTILSEKRDASVSVMLSFTSQDNRITNENAQSIATFLSNVVGNEDTKKISIIDDKGNMLFGGEDSELLGGVACELTQ